MIRTRKVIFGLAVCFTSLFLTVPGAAAPSVTGSSGMIRIPSADVLRSNEFSTGYYYWQDGGAAVAAVGLPPNIEVSASVPWQNGSPGIWNVNAKFSLNQEMLLIPAVAVGLENIAGQSPTSIYGVISKSLPYGYRIHLGAGNGRFSGFFGAIEKVLNPTKLRKKPSGFPVTSIIAEMDGRKMNYGARIRLAHGLRLDAGWLGQDKKMYLGLTYTN